MDNRFGRQSVLILETELKEGKTKLKDSFFTSPFKIAKPFYNVPGNIIGLCIMNASAGILEGDAYKIEVTLGENSQVELTTQSYTKIHKMNSGCAEQNISINLKKGALLKFMPQPTIPFAGSRFLSKARINLAEESMLLFSDVLSCGRLKMSEQFGFDIYKSRTEVLYKEKIIFADNMMLEPGRQDINGTGFYEGYTHQATIMIFGDRIKDAFYDDLNCILSKYSAEIEYGITRTFKHGILIRALGHQAEILRDIQIEIGKYMH